MKVQLYIMYSDTGREISVYAKNKTEAKAASKKYGMRAAIISSTGKFKDAKDCPGRTQRLSM